MHLNTPNDDYLDIADFIPLEQFMQKYDEE